MAEEHPERTEVRCSCGARLRVKPDAIGKKAKCPKCGETFVVTPAVPPEAAAPTGLLMDDLAKQEQSGAAVPTALGAGLSTGCPNCAAPMALGARMCTACGYDAQTGRTLQGASPTSSPPEVGGAKVAATAAAKLAGSFVLGTVLSAVGAAIGGIVWYVVAQYLNAEVGYIAWGVGLLAGVGMAIGHRRANPVAGVVAACMAAAGIISAKAVIFFSFWAAVFSPDLTDLDLQRQLVTAGVTEDVLDERGLESEEERESQWDSAYEDAERRVAQMSDEEVRAAWKAFHEELESSTEDFEPGAEGDEPGDEEFDNSSSGIREMIGFFFSSMFDLFDLLWFFLGMGTAFKIAGSGLGALSKD